MAQRFFMKSLLTNPYTRFGSPTRKRKQITGVDPPWLMIAEVPWEGGSSQESTDFSEIHNLHQAMKDISEKSGRAGMG